ncbi:hypothetical protein BDB01DRAFT_795614 [Pilobolus umbonatus]|nr:hypothetical protein BDB01DRAFT_795614 [Pilobolus umbonatus]
MTADEYFDDDIKRKAIRVKGHFEGWVNPTVMQRYGIEASASEAWELNGGGIFTYNSSARPNGSKKRKGPGSNAKDFALTMFKKNPNQYFYRHNEPGEEQWLHDWLEEEREMFINLARQYGCGDKWGLFASYIPHRVGYQCSNFYRQDIIRNGIVFDPSYLFNSSGTPVYVGQQRFKRINKDK